MYIKPDVSTWCIGQACSMGSVLLAAGTKGKRHALPHSRIMIHQPSGGMQVENVFFTNWLFVFHATLNLLV